MMETENSRKKKNPLSVLASLAAASNEPSKASPSQTKEKETSHQPPSKGTEKSPKSTRNQKKKRPPSSEKKRKRDQAAEDRPETEADHDAFPHLKAVQSNPAHAFIDAATDVSLANQFQLHQLQQLQMQQEQQRLLMNERFMLENSAFNRIPGNFLGARHPYATASAALEQEELEILRRRREQLWMNMQAINNPQQNAQAEVMMRAAAAAASANGRQDAAGLGNRAGLFMGNQTNMGAGMGGSMNFNPLAGQQMGGSFSLGLMGSSIGTPTSSQIIRDFSAQAPMGHVHNPAIAAVPQSSFSAISMGGNPGFGSESAASKAATVEPAAKRLAPARGVFNKNIKSSDDVIDTLARANARLYKSDAKKPGQRFRGYQCEQWTQKFQELLEFKEEHGNCQVPHCYKRNIGLARWVKRQRYQYKLMIDGKQSTMTEERVKLLEDIGFIWDSHAATWEERLNELREYRSIHGDCNVPSSYAENPKLATWIKCQRRQYKLLQEGRTSNMTLERMTELQRVGFCWRVQER